MTIEAFEMNTPVADTFFDGQMTVFQPQRGTGYRFNIDSVLVTSMIPECESLMDVGCGSGIIGLQALWKGRAKNVVFVERQAQLVQCCAQTIEHHGLQNCTTLVEGDLRELTLPKADVVVFNPPYEPVGRGRAAKVAGVELARREHHGALEDFVHAAERTAAMCWVCIAPVARLEDLQRAARSNLTLRFVHTRAGTEATHVLARSSDTTEELPPLRVHRGPGREYTDEVYALLSPPGAVPSF